MVCAVFSFRIIEHIVLLVRLFKELIDLEYRGSTCVNGELVFMAGLMTSAK